MKRFVDRHPIWSLVILIAAALLLWMIIAPWEHDYLIWSLHHLVELGHSEAARPRDFLLRLRVGALSNAPGFDPMLATPYRFVVGEQTPEKKVIFYEDWKRASQT